MPDKFEVLQMRPEFANSILIQSGDDCVIFDAWGRADDWEKLLANEKLNLRAIYSTHGHFDHIAAAPHLAQRFNVPWYMNHGDLPILPHADAYLKSVCMPTLPASYAPPTDLCGGQLEILPGMRMQIIETPGHSPGGIAAYFPSEKVLIIGDTIFQDSIGRYDLPGGNLNYLKQSIEKILDMNLPDDTVVIHGHGENTTIGWLKKNNKYFKA